MYELELNKTKKVITKVIQKQKLNEKKKVRQHKITIPIKIK